MIIAYGVMFAVALLVPLGYMALVRTRELWLLLLYICVAVTNFGYFLLSLSETLGFALFANKVAYLGSVFLLMCTLMSIMRLCGFTYKKRLPAILAALAVGMFALICTTGHLPLYYREATLAFVNGAAKLVKVYGVLHFVHSVYMFMYFAAMVFAIAYAVKTKKIGSHKHAALMASVVCGNLTIWIIEKIVPGDFEFLAISYVISELVLMLIDWMMQDYVPRNRLPEDAVHGKRLTALDVAAMSQEEKLRKILTALPDGEALTSRELEILTAVLENKKRKDIAAELFLSENTVKTYTRTLYSKLGVTCRHELYQLLLRQ